MDIDSVCVVSNSLRSFRLTDVLDIKVCGNKVFPEQNKKIFEVLEQQLGCTNDILGGRKGWQHFRLGGYQRQAIYVLTLMKTRQSKVGSIKYDFLNNIVKVAAAKLHPKCQSRQYNMANFSSIDQLKVLRVFSKDWDPLIEAIENKLAEDNFTEQHNIERMFYYCCVHGIQNSKSDITTLFDQMNVIRDCPEIQLAQMHVATNVKSEKGQLLLVDKRKIGKLLNSNGFDTLIVRHYENYLIKSIGSFT